MSANGLFHRSHYRLRMANVVTVSSFKSYDDHLLPELLADVDTEVPCFLFKLLPKNFVMGWVRHQFEQYRNLLGFTLYKS